MKIHRKCQCIKWNCIKKFTNNWQKKKKKIQISLGKKKWKSDTLKPLLIMFYGGACGVMVIVVGNEHSNTSSNPQQDWLHFT